MIKLRGIKRSTLWDIACLSLGEEGERYIATNSDTILQAIFSKKLKYVKGIYHNKVPIGLTYFYPYRDSVWISRFMIDHKLQGQGYGTKAFKKVIDVIKEKYSPKTIKLSTSNPIAISLYNKFGFVNEKDDKAERFYDKYKEDLLTLRL